MKTNKTSYSKTIIHKKYIRLSNYYLNGCKLSKDKEYLYECNWAIKPNLDKLTDKWSEVTCKNCLKIRTKLLNELNK